MNMRSSTQTKAESSFTPVQTGLLQRQCATCRQHTIAGGERAECQKKQSMLSRPPSLSPLQRRATNQAEPSEVPPIVHEVLQSPGQPLDSHTRGFMESRFDHDFSGVRVHTDPRAVESARAVNALAYTIGRNVVFGAGQYAPTTTTGRRLLAHELTHVMQQSDSTFALASPATVPLRFALDIGRTNDVFEQQAEQIATHLAEPKPIYFRPIGELRLQREAIDEPNVLRPRSRTLPYREATQLLECIRIMGEQNSAYCRHEVLGEPMPPMPTHHQLPGITTPQPISVPLNPNGTTNFPISGVNVIFQPDVNSSAPAMNNRAETSFNISFGTINFVESGGKITSFTGPGTAQVTIQTTYGLGVTSSSPSGYGRGTTVSDIAAGKISLGFHEGQHGLDFVEFLSQNPFPQFRGRVGMTTRRFQRAIRDYHSAINDYREQMNRFSVLRTDCVERTIDESNQAQGFRTTICRQVTGPKTTP